MLEEKLKKKIIINAENRLEMIALIRQSAIHDSQVRCSMVDFILH